MNRSIKVKDEPIGLRAAQYVRMSTDPQKYSIEIQVAAIAAYAARRGIQIVRTYEDRGRSGLHIKGRDGLTGLVNDIQFGRANFDCLLVFDISRWGRFQDVDESAYYEFICKRAGINVHYCAEEFENDGSLASVVLKSLGRVRAADFSKQLSRNVFMGQCNIVNLGYWRGGPPAYGLRRKLLDERGRPKMLLQNGQRKNLKTERVILVPGPKREVETVRRIFALFVVDRKSRSEIAAELNAERIPNARGNPWSMLTISNLLKNEAYLGHLVFNRRSMKLGERQVENPPETWIRRDNAFSAIVPSQLFAKAQKRMQQLANGREETDQQILDRLAALKRKKGHLSLKLIQASDSVPDATVYTRRFGSLAAAYQKVGFSLANRYRFTENAERMRSVTSSIADDIVNGLGARSVSTTFLEELNLLTIGGCLTVAIAVARCVSDGGARAKRWEVRKIKYKKADVLLLVRMNSNNTRVKDFFMLPTADIPLGTDGRKLRVTDRIFGRSRLNDFNDLLGALRARLHACPSLQDGRTAASVHVSDHASRSKSPQTKITQIKRRSKRSADRARR